MKRLRIMKTGITMMVALFMMLLGSSSVFAQHENPATDPLEKKDSVHMDQELLEHDPDMKYDDEVKVEDLPDMVTSSIEESYPDHEIAKIHQARDGSYKVKLEKGDEHVTVYYSITGEPLKVEGTEDEKDW